MPELGLSLSSLAARLRLPISPQPPAQVLPALLTEAGDHILLEDGTRLLTEWPLGPSA